MNADPADFSPPLLRIQERPPAPLAGWMLRLLIALVAGTMLWAALGELDIVAVAEGKLVPSSYLKIVQPSEQGIVRTNLFVHVYNGCSYTVRIRIIVNRAPDSDCFSLPSGWRADWTFTGINPSVDRIDNC